MTLYHSAGTLPPKRHIAFRRLDGQLLHEHLVGNRGFAGPSSLLYHLRPPTGGKTPELLGDVQYDQAPAGPLTRRHVRTSQLPAGGSPTLNRIPLLFNGDVAIATAAPDRDDEHYWRNGDADEYLYVSSGTGRLQSQFGELTFGPGEQVVVPRGLLYRLRLDGPARLLVVESRGPLRWPRRYHNELGQLLEGAPFSERAIRRPTNLQTIDEEGEFVLITKAGHRLTRQVLTHHPFDVVGWDGYYYPWALSIHEFEPITGTIHQPPPVHQLLEGDGFVLCNFCPRPYDFHPEAIPAPYNHSNIGTDEVLYYASEKFMSRKGIESGSVTWHPDGVPHGPHPGLYEQSMELDRTEEYAIMIDTTRPLHLGAQAADAEDPDYPASWME